MEIEEAAEKAPELRITRFRSGVVKITGDVNGGSFSVDLLGVYHSPPAGVRQIEEVDQQALVDIFQKTITDSFHIIKRINQKAIDGQ